MGPLFSLSLLFVRRARTGPFWSSQALISVDYVSLEMRLPQKLEVINDKISMETYAKFQTLLFVLNSS
jgi:hypothetical protein